MEEDRLAALEREVAALRDEVATIQAPAALLTIREASRLLGISERTFRRRVATGAIPGARRQLGVPRWMRDDILRCSR